MQRKKKNGDPMFCPVQVISGKQKATCTCLSSFSLDVVLVLPAKVQSRLERASEGTEGQALMGTFRKLSSATFRRGNAAEAVIQVGPRQDFDLTVTFLAFVKFFCVCTKHPQVVCWQPTGQP